MLAPALERKDRQGEVVEINGLFGTTLVIAGGGVSAVSTAFADSVDGFLAVSEACIQPQRRRTGDSLIRECDLAVFRRPGVLHI